MAKITYVPKAFTRGHANTIHRANAILEEYAAQGFVLTLRQLYYQFVARGFIPNKQKSYKRLGGIIGDARLAGRIDWEHLEDRSRNLQDLQKFGGPQDALNKLVEWYHVDMWESQEWRPEVWIEKDALSGVIAGVCRENDVPYFSCRGYTSLSEMWRASLRLRANAADGHKPYIIHFGDHDPSGIDMSRDIVDRLRDTFMAGFEFVRVALNMDQIRELNPPPNPAKVTDSRFKVYRENFGDESWELDALEPGTFRTIIQERLDAVRDGKQWRKDAREKEKVREQLREIAGDWDRMPLLRKESNELAEVVQACREAGLENINADRAAEKHVRKLAADLKASRDETDDFRKKLAAATNGFRKPRKKT